MLVFWKRKKLQPQMWVYVGTGLIVFEKLTRIVAKNITNRTQPRNFKICGMKVLETVGLFCIFTRKWVAFYLQYMFKRQGLVIWPSVELLHSQTRAF